MKKILIILIFILIIIFLTAYKMPNDHDSSLGIIRHDREIKNYKDLGSRTEFNCVGRYADSEISNDYAVGVLISPKWVLTAAHFVKENSVWKFGENIYKTKKIIKHPKLKPDAEETQWDGCDLALAELQKPVLDVQPAIRYNGDKELGSVITKVGFGYVGDGKLGMSTPKIQERLGGQNIIDAIGGTFENRQFNSNVMVCDFDSPESSEFNHFGTSIPLTLEIGGSKGDSGGGIFMEENDRIFLIGIVSGALNRNIKYGSVLALARVSTANEWIDSVIKISKMQSAD